MKKQLNLFTSESVSEGHPDKVADQISDAILDACLEQDPMSHVACETFVTTDYCLIGGEITTKAHVNYDQIAREVIRDIGYTKPEYGFNADTVKVDVKIKTQSPDIAMGVENNDSTKIGAGDQGIMFGYASNETEGYMPLAISLAHKLVRVATKLRKEGKFVHARPDMKSQVTIDYEDNKSPRLVTVLMSIQHDPDINMDEFKKYVKEDVILPVVRSFSLNEDFQLLINPTGSFVIGGPMGDTGLTGRKIIVDTYGGASRHGGGAFSGKDPTKVDRSAAYMARYIAKNLVAAGVADRLEIQLGYAIGVSEPVSLGISTFGTSHYSDEQILSIINQIFDLRPGKIIEHLSLRKPTFKYHEICNYGHLGRPDQNIPWEKLDKVEDIKKLLD
ncbi:MAG: methionine adenosyltransferase [Bacillales bacterium]|nr:methionine adenosyltransferase [Bacillales bacterium]MDY6002711.1 methionine adenosyltransferase [Bacilli bacterium]